MPPLSFNVCVCAFDVIFEAGSHTFKNKSNADFLEIQNLSQQRETPLNDRIRKQMMMNSFISNNTTPKNLSFISYLVQSLS